MTQGPPPRAGGPQSGPGGQQGGGPGFGARPSVEQSPTWQPPAGQPPRRPADQSAQSSTGQPSQAPPGQQERPPTGQSVQSPAAQQSYPPTGRPPQSSAGQSPTWTPPQESPQGAPGQAGQPGQQASLVGPGGRWSEPLVGPMAAEEIGQREVVTAQPDTPVRTVVASMSERDVGTVVVVEDERPVGIVTDRMVALALESDPEVSTRAARELMSEPLVTVTTGTSLDEVVSKLADEGIRRVPVVDDRGRLRGIVSLDDVLVLLGGQLERLGRVVEKQVPGY